MKVCFPDIFLLDFSLYSYPLKQTYINVMINIMSSNVLYTQTD